MRPLFQKIANKLSGGIFGSYIPEPNKLPPPPPKVNTNDFTCDATQKIRHLTDEGYHHILITKFAVLRNAYGRKMIVDQNGNVFLNYESYIKFLEAR